MLVRRLWLTDFRSYARAGIELAPGLTAVLGANGSGKTNLLEAIGYLATLASFRSATPDALVRTGAAQAVVRAEGERAGRQILVEAEILPSGRGRVLVNHQRLVRARDLLGSLRVTVFTPDDLSLVKGGPSERRRFLDDLMVQLQPRADTLRTDIERILRQRNALLRQTRGRLDAPAATTLDVWDARLAETGEAIGRVREDHVARLLPSLRAAYAQVAGPVARADSGAHYTAPWRAGGLAAALAGARSEDLRRGVTTVGPHRDDLELTIGGAPARTHASQGEQRSLALALRLASHRTVTDHVGEAPVLLLDDVFSELDPDRSDALVTVLPGGQAILTTASQLPPGVAADRVLRVKDGTVLEEA